MKKSIFFKLISKLLILLILICILPGYAIAQNPIEVKGVVKSDAGSLAGATVTLKEDTKVSALTDSYGNYSIKVPNNGTLVFTLVGYRSLEVPVKTKSIIDVNLIIEFSSLNDVVVVGYGTKRKASLTAAVSTLKGEALKNVPITNLSNGLGGRVSGVIVKQGSGEPGYDGSNIYIRGISSTGNTRPLIIVDGIPRDDFSQLDPNSIESFSVLKDAAAVAPYGVAAANGVILVTTKRGKTGQPSLRYNGYVGFQNPTTLPKFANAHEYALLRNLAAKNEGTPLPYSDIALQKYKDGSDQDAYPTEYVWDALVNKNALLTSHNIELSGGTDRVTYYASLGYQKQEGMWKTTSNERYNFTMNLDAKVTNTTKLALGIIGRVSSSERPPSDQGLGNTTGRIFELAQYQHPGVSGPIRFSNGMFGSYVASAIFGTGYSRDDVTSLYPQITLTQELPFIKGLSFKGTVAYDPTYTEQKTWKTPMQVASINTSQQPYVITDGIFGDPKPTLYQSYQNSKQLTYQAGLYYSASHGNHNLSIAGVVENKNNWLKGIAVSNRNYNVLIDEINMGSATPSDWGVSGYSSAAKQLGYVYRVGYDYSGKYMVEASGRYDGSYLFAPDKRYGFFPAVSVGWRISKESFLQNVKALDNLKIRASYGEVGAPSGSPFQYLTSYNTIPGNYVISGNPVSGFRQVVEPNVNITWERSKKTDIGLEIGLWKGLFDLEFDYFYEKRSNMLVNPDVVVPLEYGIGLSQVNGGIMDNRGFEVMVKSQHNLRKDLRIGLSGNLTYAQNKLLQVFETGATYNNPNRRLTGRPLGTQFGLQALGLFQQSDFESNGNLKSGIATQFGKLYPGDIRYRDINNDGKIDQNDLTAIGDPSAAPRTIYGLSPTVQYKNFSLELLFQGAAKVNWYYSYPSILPFYNGTNGYVHNFDSWTPENPNAKYPRLTAGPSANTLQGSSYWMANAAYLRLKTITLSYNLPSSVMKILKLQSITAYASGQNLFTWTDLMYDPEIGPNSAYIPSSGWTYPQQKVISVGLNVTF